MTAFLAGSVLFSAPVRAEWKDGPPAAFAGKVPAGKIALRDSMGMGLVLLKGVTLKTLVDKNENRIAHGEWRVVNEADKPREFQLRVKGTVKATGAVLREFAIDSLHSIPAHSIRVIHDTLPDPNRVTMQVVDLRPTGATTQQFLSARTRASGIKRMRPPARPARGR